MTGALRLSDRSRAVLGGGIMKGQHSTMNLLHELAKILLPSSTFAHQCNDACLFQETYFAPKSRCWGLLMITCALLERVSAC